MKTTKSQNRTNPETNLRKRIAFTILVISACLLGNIHNSYAQSQTYTGNSTFNVPLGVTSVQVEAWGGGGAGGGAAGNLGTRIGGGGSGGKFTRATNVAVTGGSPVSVTVGGGGLGASNADGGNGGTSTFASTIPVTATGGGGGKNGSSATPGAGGGVSTGVTYNGGSGAAATTSASGGGGGGAGNGGNGGNAGTAPAAGTGGSGTVPGGSGAAGRTGSGDGTDASALAGGGSGARVSTDLARTGGDGFRGQIIVSYTCPTYALTSAASATGPFCGASTSIVTLRSSSMVSGTYTITYTLSGATTATGSTATMTFASGSGSGTFTTSSLAAGVTNITVTAITSSYCVSSIGVNNTASVMVSAAATAVSGTAITTCAGNGAVNITAGSSSGNNSGIQWSTNNGSGTFTNANSLTLATYTPSEADISAGSVTLILTASGNAPCSNVSSNKTLTINQAPTASAGGTSTICSNQTATVSGASSSNGTIAWTENGAGTITSGSNTLTPTYTPAAGDSGNSVVLLMTVSNAGCSSATATFTINVVGAPTAIAGSAFSTCSVNGPVNITAGSSATNNSGITWSTNGTGTLTNANSLTLATYEPSAADIATGSVTFLLTVTGNGPCANATSSKTLSISKQPTATAGGTQTICQNGTATVSGATSSNGTISWIENGAGTITAGATTLTPTYTAAAGDANNNVTLTMTVSNSPCVAATATYTIHVNGSATAVAGTAIVACANESPSITAGSSATNFASTLWTSSGTGTFSNAGSLTLATYTPSAADISAGSVTLTLTSFGNAPCSNATSTKILTIRAVPVTTGVSICPGGSGSLTSSTTCASTAPISSGAKFPASGITSGAGTAWTNPGNIISDNSSYATSAVTAGGFGNSTSTSQTLVASSFGFAIPSDATILGIQATIGRYANVSVSGNVKDVTVVLIKAGTGVGTNKAVTGTNWPTSEGTASYGSTTDLWSTTWTPAQINASNFGIALASLQTASLFGTTTATVDYMQLTVTYSVPGTLNWYTVSSGGTPIGSGSSFNPVGVLNSGLANTNTPGTKIFYAECSTVAGCRTATSFTINPLPTVNFTGLAAIYCETDGSASITANNAGGTFSGAGITNTGAGTASFNPVTAGVGPNIITYVYTNENGCTNSVTQTVNVNGNVTYYADADGDTFGNIAVTSISCIGAPAGYVANNTDCNDNDNTKNQTYPFYADNDNDTYGAGSLVNVCAVNSGTPPAGYSINGTDCNDNDAAIHQTYPFYADADNDSYGAGSLVSVCALDGNTPPAGYSLNGSDCNDSNVSIYQSAVLFVDADNDGYDNGTQTVCYGATIPSGFSGTSNGSDCNDNDNTKHNLYPFYTDSDSDNYGAGNQIAACAVDASTPPAGYSLNNTDCDDANANIYQTGLFYVDTDNDGYTSGATAAVCYGASTPSGYAVNNIGIDCNDNVFAINPGHAEVLYNGVDDNCDGQLDEGGQIKTKVLPSNCGTTLTSIGSLIGITTVSSAITGYRIKLVNGSNVQILEKNVPHFTLTEFAMHEYATTYTVSIELQRLGVWLGYYGDSCFVSSPAVLAEGGAASVSPSQCGATLSRINTLIATTSLPGVTGYRFQITNLTNPIGPNVVQVISRTQNWFSLQMLAQYNYGTTYRIEIAVKTTGSFGGFGSPCEITSPPAPSLEVCDGIITASTSRVAASSLNGVTQYRFQIQRDSDGATTTIDRGYNWFTFAMVPGYTPNAIYNVRVAVMTTGTWSPLGDACQITSPPSVSRNIAQTGSDVKSNSSFSVVAYPNPFAGDFGFNMTTTSEDIVQIMVYDMSGRTIDKLDADTKDLAAHQLGAQYPAGVYNVVVTQGENVKTLRVVKR